MEKHLSLIISMIIPVIVSQQNPRFCSIESSGKSLIDAVFNYGDYVYLFSGASKGRGTVWIMKRNDRSQWEQFSSSEINDFFNGMPLPSFESAFGIDIASDCDLSQKDCFAKMTNYEGITFFFANDQYFVHRRKSVNVFKLIDNGDHNIPWKAKVSGKINDIFSDIALNIAGAVYYETLIDISKSDIWHSTVAIALGTGRWTVFYEPIRNNKTRSSINYYLIDSNSRINGAFTSDKNIYVLVDDNIRQLDTDYQKLNSQSVLLKDFFCKSNSGGSKITTLKPVPSKNSDETTEKSAETTEEPKDTTKESKELTKDITGASKGSTEKSKEMTEGSDNSILWIFIIGSIVLAAIILFVCLYFYCRANKESFIEAQEDSSRDSARGNVTNEWSLRPDQSN